MAGKSKALRLAELQELRRVAAEAEAEVARVQAFIDEAARLAEAGTPYVGYDEDEQRDRLAEWKERAEAYRAMIAAATSS